MPLAGAGRTVDDDVVAVPDPVATVGQMWTIVQASGRSQSCPAFCRRTTDFSAVTLEAPAGSVGQVSQVTVVRPAFALGSVGERVPPALMVAMRNSLEHPVGLGRVHDEELLAAHLDDSFRAKGGAVGRAVVTVARVSTAAGPS